MGKKLDTSKVKRRRAFFGKITAKVRRGAAKLCRGAEGRIVDVGCGNGLFFAELEPREGVTLVGVDYSAELLAEAREVFAANQIAGSHFVRGDAFLLPLKPGAFDRVLLLNTLLNLPDKDAVLRVITQLTSLCAPQGRIIMDIRNAKNPFLRLKYWWHSRRETLPTKAYGLDEVAEWFRPHGFQIARKKPVGSLGCIFPLAYVLDIERKTP